MCKTRHFATFTAGFCFVAALAAPAGDVFFTRGYLPVIGPEPLRFRSAEPVVNTFLPLVPLPPAPVKADSAPTPPLSEQADPVNPFALTESLAPAVDTNATIMEAISPPPIVTPAPEIPSMPIPGAMVLPPSDQPISPQTFLQYFNGATNAPRNPRVNGGSVNFNPPRGPVPSPAPSAPPGKATFSTSP